MLIATAICNLHIAHRAVEGKTLSRFYFKIKYSIKTEFLSRKYFFQFKYALYLPSKNLLKSPTTSANPSGVIVMHTALSPKYISKNSKCFPLSQACPCMNEFPCSARTTHSFFFMSLPSPLTPACVQELVSAKTLLSHFPNHT